MLGTTNETLRQEFSRFKPGSVERVKKLTDYAFIHYRYRDDAISALSLMNGAIIDGATVEVMLAKPAVIKDGSGASRRSSSKGYVGNGNAAGGGGGRMGTFVLHRSNGGMMGGAVDGDPPLRTLPLSTRVGSLIYTSAVGKELHSVCLLFSLCGHSLALTQHCEDVIVGFTVLKWAFWGLRPGWSNDVSICHFDCDRFCTLSSFCC